jgi:hypothetical protein
MVGVVKRVLSDPIWQGIEAIVGIVAIVVTLILAGNTPVTPAASPTPLPTATPSDTLRSDAYHAHQNDHLYTDASPNGTGKGFASPKRVNK